MPEQEFTKVTDRDIFVAQWAMATAIAAMGDISGNDADWVRNTTAQIMGHPRAVDSLRNGIARALKAAEVRHGK